ncbi:hypothetical protein N1031_03795 [Herbiconiux moechotypicola]|nr:hypothetical protein [Herbiconiux moechotypicola]MCS5728874.1 hypothetical protein [Herbiconiux moechotypicola]
MGDFSLLPSLLALVVVVAGLVVVSTLLRRRARRRPAPAIGGAPLREPVDELRKRASIRLVQMDDGIRAAEEELEFARAEFGEAAAHEFADALGTARRRASEAFALQQRLDDSEPDTEQEQRDWSRRILALSDAALALSTAQSRAFAERRRAEGSAADSLRRLDELLATVRVRGQDALRTLATVAGEYDGSASSDLAHAAADAQTALDSAQSDLRAARAELETDPLAAISRRTRSAEAELARAGSVYDAIERLPHDLATASARLADAITAAGLAVRDAQSLRDRVDDHADTVRIAEAGERLRSVAASAAARRPAHPVADLDALARATAELDTAVAVARSAQQRIDSAREALAGALRIAESHIATAEQFIGSRRGGVGTDARTRLASAHRELERARLESDPLVALDTARRAATYATDADALARYDALHA